MQTLDETEGPKVAIIVEMGSIGNATVFVEIDAGRQVLSPDQAAAKAHAALTEVASASASTVQARKSKGHICSDALYRSWALPSASVS